MKVQRAELSTRLTYFNLLKKSGLLCNFIDNDTLRLLNRNNQPLFNNTLFLLSGKSDENNCVNDKISQLCSVVEFNLSVNEMFYFRAINGLFKYLSTEQQMMERASSASDILERNPHMQEFPSLL